jgi:hypothetical protein
MFENLKIISVSLFVVLLFNSCYKLAHEKNFLYVGHWGDVEGTDFIDIKDDGRCVYRIGGYHAYLVYGTVVARGNKLKVDNVKFKVNQKPQFDSICSTCTWSSEKLSFYSMVINGVTYRTLK